MRERYYTSTRRELSGCTIRYSNGCAQPFSVLACADVLWEVFVTADVQLKAQKGPVGAPLSATGVIAGAAPLAADVSVDGLCCNCQQLTAAATDDMTTLQAMHLRRVDC